MKKNMILFNAIKSTIAVAFSNLIGYFLYFFILRGANEDDPNGAAFRTIIFSLCVFAFSIFALLKVTKAEIKGRSEMLIFKNDFRKSNYSLNYKEYFKSALKERLWGYYIGPAVSQIPMIINFIIVSHASEKITLYEYPLPLYKWCTSSLFAYELLGEVWLLGFFVYMVSIVLSFNVGLYYSYKELFIKPSYM